MTSSLKEDEKISKFVVCLLILLFLNNRSIDRLFILANGRGRGWGGGGGAKNCMIINVKKVMVLVMFLVPVLQ